MNAPSSRFAFTRLPRFDDVEPTARDVNASEHDLIVRYAIVGIFAILAIAALRESKVIALPIAAGVIFGLVLGPAVDWMVRRNIPQHLAAASIVIVGFIIGVAALAVLTAPIAAWSDQFPAMMAALRSRLLSVFDLAQQIEDAAASVSGNKGVRLNVSDGNPLMSIAISSSTIAAGFLIFIFTVYFYLATRRHLKARVLRLCLGQDARKSAGEFFNEIETRVAIYLSVVTVVNIGIGAIAMTIAWVAGVPSPIFWGALAFVLNYLAFIGPIIVAILLFAAGLLSDTTLLAAIWPAALYYAIHLLEGNWVTPMLVGNRLTVSPFAVFLSFIFWLWVWGPVGAVLSTPLLLVMLAAQESFAKYREIRKEAEQASPLDA
ncbi:AI-2E family transporter [Terrarubrum flagellatum]|uniref:AI-2E family transporter n=1 Tax=Terrirubrum flagellatum TaxID=2895980 RepID=UPI0031452C30